MKISCTDLEYLRIECCLLHVSISRPPHFSSQASRKSRRWEQLWVVYAWEFVRAAATNRKGVCGRLWWTPDITSLAAGSNLQHYNFQNLVKTIDPGSFTLNRNILLAQRANLRTSPKDPPETQNLIWLREPRATPGAYGPLQPKRCMESNVWRNPWSFW